MRGLRSTIALLVVLVGLGAYIYFVTLRKSDAPDTAKQERLFAGLDSSKINEMKVKSESGDVTTLKRDGDLWKLVSPIEVLATEPDTSSIANAIGNVEIVRVVDENPTDVKPYGLDSPQIVIDFKSEDGKTAGHLLIGTKSAAGGNLYAKRDDQKRVVLIGQFNETTLNKSTFDLRDKTLVKFDKTKVDAVNLDLTGGRIALAKTDGSWKMTKPIAPRTDSAAVDAMITLLDAAQMKAVISTAPTAANLKKYGFDKPQAVLTTHMGSATASLTIGAKVDPKDIKDAKPDEPEPKRVYVRDASRPDVFAMEANTADELQKPFTDYRQKEAFDFRAFTATHIELTRSGQTVIFERVKAKDTSTPDTWHRVSPNPGDPDTSKVEQLLAGLADIRATSFVESKAGLDTPALTVFAKFDEGKKEERVALVKRGADAFAVRTDDVGAAKIEPGKLDDAVKLLDELSK